MQTNKFIQLCKGQDRPTRKRRERNPFSKTVEKPPVWSPENGKLKL